MTASPRLVIFDCDGVLVDSEPLSIRIDALMLDDIGLAMDEQEIIDRFVGRSPAVMAQVIADHLGHPPDPEWETRFDQLRRDAFAAELTPVEGIVEALAQISVPVCVASSSEPDSLRYKLGLTGLLTRFGEHVFSARQVEHGKPAPDLFEFAAREMGCDPPGCVVVEDSTYGVQAARAAGMRVLAYAGGLTPAHALQGPETTVFSAMRALPELIVG